MDHNENWKRILGIILVMCFLVVSAGYISHLQKAHTPIEVLQHQEQMAEQLKTLKRGDFLIQDDESIWMVHFGVQNGGHQMLVRQSVGGDGFSADPSYLARRTHHIIRQDDPSWNFAAKRFLCGTSDVAQVGSSE